MPSAKMIPPNSKPGVMRKAKAMCEKVCQFIVPVVKPFKGSTARHSNPPYNNPRDLRDASS